MPGSGNAPNQKPIFKLSSARAISPNVPGCGAGNALPDAVCESSKLLGSDPAASAGF